MKTLAVLTTTRADYGLLSPLIQKFKLNDSFKTLVLVTGSHLSSDYGLTINEINKDNVFVDKKIEILSNSDTPVDISKAMGLALVGFSNYFEERKPDALLVLGDRYECLAVCLAALNSRIPIIHLHGGEITEGAIDNAIRHSITKLSYLHFASTEEYKNRIIQMGEEPNRVFNVGAIGVENALNTPLYNKDECEKKINCKLNRYAILTFHPVTLENQTAENQTKVLLETIIRHKDILFICTKANADVGGKAINKLLEDYSLCHPNVVLFDSLGTQLYLSLVKHSLFVIGNSSSGIIEVPSFSIPTINIGDRQKGRIRSESIIDCKPTFDSINNAINLAVSDAFIKKIKNVKNPYEGTNTSNRIVQIVEEYLSEDKLSVYKTFYDCKF